MGTVTLHNTLVAANDPPLSPDCKGTITSAGYNLVGSTAGCTLPPAAGDLFNTDAALRPATGQLAYHALFLGSPAIDAGDPAACPSQDQRGQPRPLDGDNDGLAVCDIGAIEQAYQVLLFIPLLGR